MKYVGLAKDMPLDVRDRVERVYGGPLPAMATVNIDDVLRPYWVNIGVDLNDDNPAASFKDDGK